MIYLLDTNIFREMLEHFPKRGKTFEEILAFFFEGTELRNDIQETALF